MIIKQNYKSLLNFLKKEQKMPKAVLVNRIGEKYSIIKTHKNDVSLIFFPSKNIYRKFNKSQKSITKIKSEFNGLKWYCSRVKKKLNSVVNDYSVKKNFSYIETKKINGKKYKSWHPLETNYPYLIKAFKHYLKYYPKKKISYIHGDLTLDNLIFQKKNIFIIDWEYFYSKQNYRGYDIVYLFLSSVCLPYVFNKSFSKKDEKLFKIMWKLLIKKDFNREMLYNPFKFFEQNIQKDSTLKKAFKISKSKFFPFITNKNHKKRIKSIIESI